MRSLLEARRRIDFTDEMEKKGWYHSFDLPDGTHIDGYMSVEHQRKRFAGFGLPEDLSGKRVLDIGAWDGWFTFEAERRGAAVTAIDSVEVPGFVEIHKRLGSKAEYRVMDFFEIPGAGLGKFDVVLFLGVLYHLRHPLLALEIVCGMTRETAIVDSFVTDPSTWRERAEEIPSMEFYEHDELGNQVGNWVGPSVNCLMAMCRSAGFARVEFLRTHEDHAVVVCHRTWDSNEAENADTPELLAVVNSRGFGINFTTAKSEEYVMCRFRAAGKSVTAEDLRPEVDGLGAPVTIMKAEGDLWNAMFRLPPGLSPGWHTVRLRFRDSRFGAEFRVAVDMPLQVEELTVQDVSDGLNWTRGEVTIGDPGFVSCWVGGLPENADRANIGVFLGSRRLLIDFMGRRDDRGLLQINAGVPKDLPGGEYPFRVVCGGVSSEQQTIKVIA